MAQRYLKECHRLCIVAPINRAVDDQAAKKLLGDQFRRQLKLDGTYNSVTFLCSKTDDINVSEACELVPESKKIKQMWITVQALGDREEYELQPKLASLNEEYRDAQEVFHDQFGLSEVWDKFFRDFNAGHLVYAPDETSNSLKRKASDEAISETQRTLFTISQCDDFTDALVDPDAEFVEPDFDLITPNEAEHSSKSREPLSESDIKKKLEEICGAMAEARGATAALKAQSSEVKAENKNIRREISELESQIASCCIKGRNTLSRSSIQEDFALGIKELDQENAIEDDEANFDPDEDIRDYEAVAESLPVYCVSSKAFQKLCGRMRKDKMPPGFPKKEDTEIPQFQAHCK